LVWAPADADATSWLAENNQDFDQFPVKHGDGTEGILLRQGNHKGKAVREAMQPLREGLIVSADMPIADLIPELRENHHRLVLRGGRIDGLVTQSDLLKLPVRMLVFGFISHLELLFRALIQERHAGAQWIQKLDANAQQRINRKLRKFKDARLEPDPLEFTFFSDALEVLVNEPDMSASLSADKEAITNLRNDIAHAKTFINSPEDVKGFVDRFKLLRGWIERISALLRSV
jgi:hypothetical protein